MVYAYDVSGQRVLQAGVADAGGPGMATAYTASTSTGDVTGTRYYTFGGSTVAVRRAAGLSLMLGDEQGSTSVVMPVTVTGTGALASATIADAVVVTRTAYTPYGQLRGADDVAVDRGWLGQVEDRVDGATGTGLTYLNARYYDPVSMRFISPDPLMNPADPTTLDPYRYADNNPVVFTDASGLKPYCEGLSHSASMSCYYTWAAEQVLGPYGLAVTDVPEWGTTTMGEPYATARVLLNQAHDYELQSDDTGLELGLKFVSPGVGKHESYGEGDRMVEALKHTDYLTVDLPGELQARKDQGRLHEGADFEYGYVHHVADSRVGKLVQGAKDLGCAVVFAEGGKCNHALTGLGSFNNKVTVTGLTSSAVTVHLSITQTSTFASLVGFGKRSPEGDAEKNRKWAKISGPTGIASPQKFSIDFTMTYQLSSTPTSAPVRLRKYL